MRVVHLLWQIRIKTPIGQNSFWSGCRSLLSEVRKDVEGAGPPRWQTVSANVRVDDTLSAGIRMGGPLVHSRAILPGLHGTLGWHGVPVLGLGDAGQVWILLCACHQAASWSVSLSSSICGRRQLKSLHLELTASA